MSGEINQERVNDRAKLIMHRMVARRLGQDPGLLTHAREALEARSSRMPGRDFTNEWEVLLAAPLAELRRKLTSRQEDMSRLRLSSPFMMVADLGLDDVPLRRRIWRLAKRGVLRHPPPGVEEEAYAHPSP